MEKRTQYQTAVSAPSYDQFHLRLPSDLLDWYRRRATAERRKINTIIIAAMEDYRRLEDNLVIVEDEEQE